MSAVTSHLVRRVVSDFHGQIKQSPDYQIQDENLIDNGGVRPALFVMALTILVFAIAISAVQYTFGELVATLAAVEAPETTEVIGITSNSNRENAEANEPLMSLDNKNNSTKLAIDEEVLLIKQKPITLRFRTILRHLRARGGRVAPFRGLYIHLIESTLLSLFVGLVSTAGLFRHNLILRTTVEVLGCTLLTGISLWWNNYVISEPSTRVWYSRLPSRTQVRKALGPTAINAAIQRFSTVAFLYAAFALGAMPTHLGPSRQPENPKSITQSLLTCALLIVLGIFIGFFIQLPSTIAITRVRASLLAPEEEPIIPFDRTFDGQVVPTFAGGSGMLGMWQAWTGTPRETRVRVLTVCLRTFAIQIMLVLAAALTVVAEIRFMLGPEHGKKLAIMGMQMLGNA